MSISVRSCLAAGVVVTTATAIAFAPSEKEPVRAAPTFRVVPAAVQLTAPVQPIVGANAVSPADFLALIVQQYVVPPSASRPFPTPQFPPVVGGTSIDSTIKNVYNAIEPWVQYGFELATYAVGWIPYVGWLSGQIMIFYFFGERIVRSITFNIADWLGGNISFGQGLINVGVDTVNAFIQLGIDQWNYWLWPLPPLPPILPGLAAAPETAELTMALSIEDSLEPLSSEAGTTDKDEVVVESEGAQVESLDEDFTEEEAAAGEEAVSEDVGKTEETIEETDATNEEESDPVVTEEDTHTKVTRTDKSTTDSSGNIEAQGEIRGPDVDTSIHQDADGSVAQGADGTEGAAGAGRVDGHAPEETVKNTDDSAAPTDATKADADTGDNDDGTE